MDNDYQKRDYLLPEGCKDLVDVLKLKAQPVQPPPGSPPQPPPIIGEMLFPESMRIVDLAEVLKQRPFKIIADLIEFGVFTTNVQQQIVFETIARVVRKYGYLAKRAA